MRSITVGKVLVGGGAPLAIIAGPCVAESVPLCMQVGTALRDRCVTLGMSYIFKASYDKANRSSADSARGLGPEQGLKVLQQVRNELGVAVTTDIHEPVQAGAAAQVADLLQIPAFLCRQTDLLLAAAATGKPVNVKKGQFLSPAEMGHVVQKLEQGFSRADIAGESQRIMLTERGTFFGYHHLVNDFVGLGDLMDLGWPVCFDVTHSTQRPGEGLTSGGRPERAPLLASCAVAAGVSSLFIETHPQPDQAMSDAASMLPLHATLSLLEKLARLRDAVVGD